MSRYLFNRTRQVVGEEDCIPELDATCEPDVPPEMRSDTAQFYQHLGAEADVNLEPGYNQDEFFDDQFERRAHEIQRTPPAASAVSVISPKQGPWTGNNNLGIERYFDPDANNQQTILKMPEWGFPEMWTICLGMNDFSFLPNPDPIGFEVTALIQFGIGGAMQEVEVDWLNGSAISLPMNAVNVVARYTFQESNEFSSSAPIDLRLRCTICRGRSHFARPTRSIAIGEGVTSIPIPKFAKNVFVAPIVSAPAQNPFTFYSQDAYVELSAGENSLLLTPLQLQVSQFVSFVDFTNQRVGSPQKIPIPPTARFLNFTDSVGAPASIGARFAQFEIGI